MLFSRQNAVQQEAQRVVAKCRDQRFCVEKTLDAGPANIALDVFEGGRVGMKQSWCWASRDVVADEDEDIAENGQEEGDDEGARRTEELELGVRLWFGHVVVVFVCCLQDRMTMRQNVLSILQTRATNGYRQLVECTL